jgi:hypothetical protein
VRRSAERPYVEDVRRQFHGWPSPGPYHPTRQSSP